MSPVTSAKRTVTREPAVTFGAIAAVIVVLFGTLDIIVEPSTIETILAAIVPLLTAFVTRQKVTPVA